MINPLFLMMRWVQTVPLSLLTFAAFQDQDLRLGRALSCIFSVVYMLLSGIAMAALSPASSLDGQRNIVVRDISLAVFLCVYFWGWACSVRAPAIRKGLVMGLLLHYWMGLQTAGDVFSALILRDNYVSEVSAESGSLTYNLSVLAVTVITWPLVYLFLRKVLRKNLPMLDSREAAHGGIYLCVVFLLFSVATYNPRFDSLPDTPLFVAALILTDMIAYYIFFQEIGAVRQRAETERQLLDYQMQYQEIVNRMENVRRLRHDLRHHLNVLGALNAQGRTKELAEYLEQYGKVYEDLEKQQFCGDPAVDSVLSYYLAQAKEESIPVDCRICLRGGSGIAHMDMTVLLGNCMENALEAVRRLPPERQRITVEMQPVGAMLLLRVVNSCEAGADTDGFTSWEAFPSSKGKKRRGIGLRSVSAIADKYSGTAQFQREDGEFTVRVVLCTIPVDQEGTE